MKRIANQVGAASRMAWPRSSHTDRTEPLEIQFIAGEADDHPPTLLSAGFGRVQGGLRLLALRFERSLPKSAMGNGLPLLLSWQHNR
jgi:hypothetical protein